MVFVKMNFDGLERVGGVLAHLTAGTGQMEREFFVDVVERMVENMRNNPKVIVHEWRGERLQGLITYKQTVDGQGRQEYNIVLRDEAVLLDRGVRQHVVSIRGKNAQTASKRLLRRWISENWGLKVKDMPKAVTLPHDPALISGLRFTEDALEDFKNEGPKNFKKAMKKLSEKAKSLR